MRVITRKSDVSKELEPCLAAYRRQGLLQCANLFRERLLEAKVKFPLLEFCAHTLYSVLDREDQIPFCNHIAGFNTIGGNVILGIMLQNRLPGHHIVSFEKASEYISNGKLWYVSDLIGERVFGFSLLTTPEETLPLYSDLVNHESNWVVRAAGAGGHYAIKKGLNKRHVKKVFKLLLSKGNITDREARAGIGWAAKTTAKFHPEIISFYKNAIENPHQTGNWLRTKVNIGLQRHQYAKGN